MWTRLLLRTVCLLHPLRPTVNCTASFQVSLPLCTWARTLTAHLIRYTCLSLACPSERTKYSGRIRSFLLSAALFLSAVYKNLWTRLHHGCLSLLFLFSARSVWRPVRANTRQQAGWSLLLQCRRLLPTRLCGGECELIRVYRLLLLEKYK